MYSDVFCKVYNEFGWNYYPEAFAEQLLKWLSFHSIRPRRSMDLACGTGVLCRILKDHGIEAAGMDLSQGMIDIAREASPDIPYDVADMITYRPAQKYDLVTCTGDALNHILDIRDVEKIFRNVYEYLNPDGWFVFDILNEHEVSTSEPFILDFSDSIQARFQITRPAPNQVNLQTQVYENGALQLEENIREIIHDPEEICRLLLDCRFRDIQRSNCLPGSGAHPGTTWFIIARK